MRRGTTMSLSFPPFTRAVKQLLIANGAVFLIVAIVTAFTSPSADSWVNFHFGLVPTMAVLHGWIWQFVTYSFMHAGVLHILFNLLALWMFGAQLEVDWGYSLFMQFYFFCVIGAAISTAVVSFTGLSGSISASSDGRRVRRDLRHPGRIRHLARRLGDHAVSHSLHDQGPLLRDRVDLPGAIRSTIVVPQPGAIDGLHGAPRRGTVWVSLPEVRSPTGIWISKLRAAVWAAEFLLSLETKTRGTEVRSLYAEARSRRLQTRGLLRRRRQDARSQKLATGKRRTATRGRRG